MIMNIPYATHQKWSITAAGNIEQVTTYSDGSIERTRKTLDQSKWHIHCETGPAVERPDGTKEWWLDGIKVDPLEHFVKVQGMLHVG